MAFIEVNAEFKQVVGLLTRIAEALERAYPPKPSKPAKPSTEEDFIRITDESLWLQELQEEAKKQVQSPRNEG